MFSLTKIINVVSVLETMILIMNGLLQYCGSLVSNPLDSPPLQPHLDANISVNNYKGALIDKAV